MKSKISIPKSCLSVMVCSTSYTSHSSSFLTARILPRNRLCIRCSFHGWLVKDWHLDYHNSGAFRTGLGVVAHSSHNTVTTMMPSICIFNKFKSGRSLHVELLDVPIMKIQYLSSRKLKLTWILIN